ncbi:hypothetical protein YTPLAS18_15280 [Nitrospira sp.]|nr:hypothetical protein YTPLAS18_15280 [Nitrospira sp.]
MRRVRPIMAGMTMLTVLLLWRGGIRPAWGVHVHGPIPDPSDTASEQQEDSRSDGSELHDRETEDELTTAAERARQQQYREGMDSNPWFRSPRQKDMQTEERLPGDGPQDRAR